MLAFSSASTFNLLVLQQLLKMVNNRSRWNLDVSALMVLVGEKEEMSYRLMQRSLLESLSPAPVTGLQCYLQPYTWVRQPSNLSYFSPFGHKSAPLRNMRLANAIELCHLLDDSETNVYRIRPSSERNHWKSCNIMLLSWFIGCWILFVLLLAILFWTPTATWIGRSNCVCFSAWSMCLRLLESRLVRQRVNAPQVSRPTDLDAIYILGRSNSCFILEGSRNDIKNWTALGLYCSGPSSTQANARHSRSIWQTALRFCSLLVLLLMFTTIPNGTTTDQVLFTLLNVLGQANVLLGQKINSKCLMSELELVERQTTESRTAVYAHLLRRYSRDGKGTAWAEAANFLPKTNTWRRWRDRVVEEIQMEPKTLYDLLLDETLEDKQVQPDVSSEGADHIAPSLPNQTEQRDEQPEAHGSFSQQ